MNSKQLANVLIKILGLSVVVHEIPTLVSLILAQMQMNNRGLQGFPIGGNSTAVVIVVLMPVIGVCLVVASRGIADWLLGSEDGQP